MSKGDFFSAQTLRVKDVLIIAFNTLACKRKIEFSHNIICIF